MQRFRYAAEALDEFPKVTAIQVKNVIKRMMDINPATLIQVMERGGKAIAEVAQCYVTDIYPEILVLIGPGYNGGATLAAARYMANDGAHPEILLASAISDLEPVVQTQLKILQGLYPDIPLVEGWQEYNEQQIPSSGSDLILDGLLGCFYIKPIEESMVSLITLANNLNIPIISNDIPSGLDADTGIPFSPTILATATVTFGIPKQGFLSPESQNYLGELYLADIGLCPNMMQQVLKIDDFPRHLPPLMYLYPKESFLKRKSL